MKLSAYSIPILIIVITALSLWGASLFAIPTVEVTYESRDSEQEMAKTDTVIMLVDGVKCRDTAQTASSALSDLKGVKHYTAFASHNRVEIEFDPEQVTVQAIKEALEGPVLVEETGEFRFNLYNVVEINGKAVKQEENSHN